MLFARVYRCLQLVARAAGVREACTATANTITFRRRTRHVLFLLLQNIHENQKHTRVTMTKELVVDTAPKRIKYLQFGILSPQEIVAMSEFEATQRDLYQLGGPGGGVRQPAPNGVLDARLVSVKRFECLPCRRKLTCPPVLFCSCRARPTNLPLAKHAAREWQTASDTTHTFASCYQSFILDTSRWLSPCFKTFAR